MAKRRLDPRGFTLLEIVIGLFVFLVGVLAVLTMHIRSIQINNEAKLRSQAVFFAETKMEELLRGSFASVTSGGPEALAPHRISWTVTDRGSHKEVAVRVEWGNKSLTIHSVKGMFE